MEELLNFRTFYSQEDAMELAAILKQEGITAEVIKNTGLIDVYLGGNYSNEYFLRIPGSDFNKAKGILSKPGDVDPEHIDSNHPLHALTNEELKDVVAKQDEWGVDNYNLAVAILKSRGITVSESKLEEIQQERFKELAERKSMDTYLIVMGYTAALFHLVLIIQKYVFLAETGYYRVFPGFFGLLLGGVILNSKTTLPNGERIHSFNDNVLWHGRTMIFCSLAAFAINLVAFLFISL